jgi:hypothetical protein
MAMVPLWISQEKTILGPATHQTERVSEELNKSISLISDSDCKLDKKILYIVFASSHC